MIDAIALGNKLKEIQAFAFTGHVKLSLETALAIAQLCAYDEIIENLTEINKTIGSFKDTTVNNTEVLSSAISDVVAELNRVDRSLGLKR